MASSRVAEAEVKIYSTAKGNYAQLNELIEVPIINLLHILYEDYCRILKLQSLGWADM
jgi:hypothetical protein